MGAEVGWIGWLVIGGLAGWIGSKIMGTDAQQGIVLNVIVGIVGAVIGGLLLGLFLDTDGSGWIMSFVTAVIGACLLLFVVKAVTGRSSRA